MSIDRWARSREPERREEGRASEPAPGGRPTPILVSPRLFVFLVVVGLALFALLLYAAPTVPVVALGEVAGGWGGPVGAYPHAGRFAMPNWQFTDEISPEDFASEAEGWVALGARVVGGCCGIGPEHVRALRERLSAGG